VNVTDDTTAATIAELNAKATRRLRRRILLLLILGWALAVAATVVDHFRPGEVVLLPVAAVLGAATFGYIKGRPVRR
jgi:hypothetical protein